MTATFLRYYKQSPCLYYRDVAVALLNHDPKWEDAMHHTVHGEKGAIITPFTMLIKEMPGILPLSNYWQYCYRFLPPGVAKVALNKCLRLGTNSVTYNFGFLEHRKNQSDGNTSMPASLRQRFSSLYQSLKKKRAELLNHPLSVMVCITVWHSLILYSNVLMQL